MAKPVFSRTKAASALPIGSPASSASRASATRLRPLARQNSGLPVTIPRKRSDLTICPTSQPTTRAASSAVRVLSVNSITRPGNPAAARASCTFRALLLNGLSIAPSFPKPHYRSRRADQVPDRSDCPFLLPPRGDREEEPGLPPSLHDHGCVPVEFHRLPRLQEVVTAVPAVGQPETSRQAAQGKFLPTAVDPEHRPIVEPYFHAVPLLWPRPATTRQLHRRW